jgi:protein-L-isoaspartate(D-aspartate) O-methyltransferase
MKREPPKSASAPVKARPTFPAQMDTMPKLARPIQSQGLTTKPPTVSSVSRVNVSPMTHRVHTSGVGMDSQTIRFTMVQKLQAQGLNDARVAQALRAVERHRFVDSALVPQAYEDTSLPIGMGQTISKPSVVARMLALLCEGRDGPLGRVLEIGTGCGYQAALLSHIAQAVYSIERLRGLHDKARENLRHLRLSNVQLILGDGMLGFSAGAPYSAIISAAGGMGIPQAWLDQLAVGGRLVAPSESPNGQQHLVVIDKTDSGLVHTVLEPVLFVPLKSGVS